MENLEDFYIIGNHIDTEIGKLHPTLIEDYPSLVLHSSILTLDKEEINVYLESLIGSGEAINDDFIKGLQGLSLLEFLKVYNEPDSDFYNLYSQYKQLFELCFKKDTFDLVESDKDLEYYIDLIKDINNIKLEKPNPNPEIERRNKLKKMLQEQKGETVSFESMFTSIEAITGRDPSKMTVYRFYKVFDRIGQIKDYDTSTMHAMVSDKAKIEPWYKNIVIQDKENYITEEQLDKARENKVLQEDL